MADRNSETHLATIYVLGRQQPSQHTFQEIFGGQASQFHLLRQTCSKFNDVMIQKRRACLKRYGHGRDVDFYQQVVRKVGHYVSQQSSVDDARTVRSLKPRPE